MKNLEVSTLISHSKCPPYSECKIILYCIFIYVLFYTSLEPGKELFFFMYIDDIVVYIRSSIHLFADYTSLYIIVESPDNAAQLLNVGLGKIIRWLIWLVKFNPVKQNLSLIPANQLCPYILQSYVGN